MIKMIKFNDDLPKMVIYIKKVPFNKSKSIYCIHKYVYIYIYQPKLVQLISCLGNLEPPNKHLLPTEPLFTVELTGSPGRSWRLDGLWPVRFGRTREPILQEFTGVAWCHHFYLDVPLEDRING